MNNLRNKTKLILSTAATLVLISGCSEKSPLPKEQPHQEVIEKVQPITVSASLMPVRKLIKSLCVSNGLSCDFSAQPSDRYTTTFNYTGDIEGLFPIIKRQTGVQYIVNDGILSMVNKDEITLYEDPLASGTEEVDISFKDMPIQEAFKTFYDRYGYSFSFDLQYTAFVSHKNGLIPSGSSIPVMQPLNEKTSVADVSKKELKTVTFFYNGNSPKEALKSFLSNLDMTMIEVKDKEFKIQDYDVAIIDKSVYFDYTMSSGGSSSGNTGSNSGSTTTSNSSSGNTGSNSSTTKVSLTENHRKDIEGILQKYLSNKGKLDMSTRGYVVIKDTPSSIKQIKRILKKEIEKEAPLSISINIVRIDLKDEYKAGVDWNAVWSNGLFGLKDFSVTSSMSQLVNGGFAFKGQFKGAEQVLSMLQDYGNTKIERSRTINARSGFLANFEATKPIPYITTTSTITGGSSSFSQGSVTPMFEEEGVVLNMLPNIDLDTNIVDLGIDVSVSEYVGDKSFDLGSQGMYTLPIVTKDKGKFAVQAKVGETIILTGFKVKKGSIGKKGIPGLSQIAVVGSLFGYQESIDDTSEILIILKVDQVKR